MSLNQYATLEQIESAFLKRSTLKFLAIKGKSGGIFYNSHGKELVSLRISRKSVSLFRLVLVVGGKSEQSGKYRNPSRIRGWRFTGSRSKPAHIWETG